MTDRTPMNIPKLLPALAISIMLVAALLAGACGTAAPTAGSSPDGLGTPGPTGTASGQATEGSAWPFVDEPEAASELEETPPDPALEPSDGEPLPDIADTGAGSDEVAGDEPLDEFDPCSLVTPAEWAAWREVDVATVEQVVLEGGEACGYRDEADTVRLAVAVFEVSGGTWLPDDVDAETLDVDGRTARWVAGYPVAVSSVLVVTLDGAELVLEISAVDGTDNQTLRTGAIEMAGIAASRWPS